jgi:ComF family protein
VGQRRTARGAIALTALSDALLAVLLAPRCAACTIPLASPTRGPVCQGCWDAIRRPTDPRCLRCGAELATWRRLDLADTRCTRCRRIPSALTFGRSGGHYEGALRRIIQAFKYEGRRSLAGPLGALMRDGGAPVLDGATVVVPVPLHPFRRLARGFNQAADLAAQLPLPCAHVLRRVRATAPQEQLGAAARRRNVHGAFAMSVRHRGDRARFIEGAVVVLVDDVRTTGSTLEQCAVTLRAAGAREVRALTVAMARASDGRRQEAGDGPVSTLREAV